MGASLALAALAAAHRVALPHAPTRLLVRFALAAVDDHAKPWARLTMADRCAALGHADDDAGRRAVERATAAITRARLAELTEGGNRSGAARYALHLAPVGSSESPPLSVELSEPKAPRSASESPPLSVRKPPAQRGPKEDRGGQRRSTRASAPPSKDRCSQHLGVAYPPPCAACRDVRLAAEASIAREAAAARESERAARAASIHVLAARIAELRGVPVETVEAAADRESPDDRYTGLRILAASDDWEASR